MADDTPADKDARLDALADELDAEDREALSNGFTFDIYQVSPGGEPVEPMDPTTFEDFEDPDGEEPAPEDLADRADPERVSDEPAVSYRFGEPDE